MTQWRPGLAALARKLRYLFCFFQIARLMDRIPMIRRRQPCWLLNILRPRSSQKADNAEASLSRATTVSFSSLLYTHKMHALASMNKNHSRHSSRLRSQHVSELLH